MMLKRMLIGIALGGVILTTTACNTVKGAGKDLQSAGQAGENAIHKKDTSKK